MRASRDLEEGEELTTSYKVNIRIARSYHYITVQVPRARISGQERAFPHHLVLQLHLRKVLLINCYPQ